MITCPTVYNPVSICKEVRKLNCLPAMKLQCFQKKPLQCAVCSEGLRAAGIALNSGYAEITLNLVFQ